MSLTERSKKRLADFISYTSYSVGVKLVFKASFDKANRTSAKSFRGPGVDEGLKVCIICNSHTCSWLIPSLQLATDFESCQDSF